MNRRRIKRLGLYGLLFAVAAVLLGLAINTSSNRGANPEPRQAEAGSLQPHSASSQPGMENADSASSNLVHSKKAGRPFTPTQKKADRGLVRTSEADYVMDAAAIMDLCSDPDVEKTVSVDDMIAYEKLTHGVDSAVAATTEQTLAILCSRNWQISPFDLKAIAAYDPDEFLANNSRPFQDSIVFIDLLQRGDGEGISDKERSDFVVEKIKSADGLYELVHTLNMFAEVGVLAPALRRYGYPQDLQGDGWVWSAPTSSRPAESSTYAARTHPTLRASVSWSATTR